MFRTRKEDSLFDNTTDINEPQVKVIEPTAAAPAAPAAPAAAAPAAPASYAPAARPAAPAAAPAAPVATAPEAPRAAVPSANSFRPGAAPNPNADLQRNRLPEAPKPAVAAAPAAPVAANTPPAPVPAARPNQRVLTVGNDILLKGEIATCDRLVIEGKVDAVLNDVHTVEISQTGSFKGSAHIEDAEISGLFEGDLVVRGRLVIYATGKVRGKISYGEVEIERGGELSGEIKLATAQPVSGRKGEKAAA